jgi:hypothetical protein
VRRAAGVVVLALSLAACGSTVQLQSTEVQGHDGLSAPGTVADPLATNSGATSQDVPGTPTGPRTGSETPTSTGRGNAVGPTEAPAGTRTALSPKAPIRVGVVYAPGADAAFAALGVSALTTGDTKAQATAVVDWINKHGALGGHPIQLFSYAMDSSASSPAAAAQEACTAMTQDHKVRYVVSIAANQQPMVSCLAKKGVGLLDDESSLNDKAMATYAGFLGNPGEMAPGRTMSVLVDDLWKRGWLTSHSKVGVFAADTPDAHATVDGFLTQALRRHGLTAASTQYASFNDSASLSRDSASAALKFRSAGVDRIIPILTTPLFLMEAASSQDYRPAYALYSTLGPGAVLEGTAPKDQLANTAGIGWQPYQDIGKGKQPGPVSSRETLCLRIMQAAGQASTSASTVALQLQVCDVLFYLQDLGALEPSMPADLLTSARTLLGKRFVPADTFRSDVTHRTDGVAGYRSLAYRQDCSCFQYVSPVQATP